MYAVVDIETTGGYAANNDITEVAIVLFDGEQIVDRYQTLVRPQRPIPYSIQVLTGITPAMVKQAPAFEEIAPVLLQKLSDCVFVAHNVNFDYSFLRHHFKKAGIDWSAPRLCTVRLTKKIVAGLSSYSLGNLCREFDIPIRQRHRAGGDVEATVRLLHYLLQRGGRVHIDAFLRRGSKEHALPLHLPADALDHLPYSPGVYYFHDKKDKVIYVGKAKNLRYRVRSHFMHNGAGRQRQEFLRNIWRISFQECHTELMAFILESVEIRRLWPAYNQSQKRAEQIFAVYSYCDQRGYLRLAVDKRKRNVPSVHTFTLRVEAHGELRKWVRQHELCPMLSYLQAEDTPCVGLREGYCRGACEGREVPKQYNARVQEALVAWQQEQPTFAIVEPGSLTGKKSCILIEKGKFYGMGELPEKLDITEPEECKPYLTPYPENEYIRGLVYAHAERFPEWVLDAQD
jgi:DNA polymerase-3 subunit epsilon